MPLPKPKDNESKDDFLKRCMGDDLMNREYPDKDQRYAICNKQLEDKSKDPKSSKKKKPFMEARSYPFEISEVRAEGNESPKIIGYAAVYNKLSEDLGGFREKIQPGFFTKVLGDDVRALFNHNEDKVLGRTKSGTLKLEENSKGLKVEISPPDTSYAKDLLNLISRGDVDQMSFQWITEQDEWDTSDLKNVVRTLVSAKELLDISPVTFPAYPQTHAQLRSAKQVYINHLEELLEDISKEEEERNKGWEDEISLMEKQLTILKKEI